MFDNTQEVIKKMAENWTQNHGGYNPQGQTYTQYRPTKLYRSTNDKWLGGVCGGIAEYYGHDPVLVRLLWIAVTLFSAGVGIIAYILFWIFVKKYPSYFVPPMPMPPANGVESVHYHYHYKSSKQNKTED